MLKSNLDFHSVVHIPLLIFPKLEKVDSEPKKVKL